DHARRRPARGGLGLHRAARLLAPGHRRRRHHRGRRGRPVLPVRPGLGGARPRPRPPPPRPRPRARLRPGQGAREHPMRTGSATRAVAACAAAGLLAAGCGPQGGEPAADEESVPHGYVEGAEETAEAQWRLVMADPDGGLHMLDPATEEVEEVGEAPGAEHAATDGRFAYVGGDAGTAVFDSGTWTVDHGDHVHYYKAEARAVGEL